MDLRDIPAVFWIPYPHRCGPITAAGQRVDAVTGVPFVQQGTGVQLEVSAAAGSQLSQVDIISNFFVASVVIQGKAETKESKI